MIDARMAYTIAHNAQSINNFIKAVDEGILNEAGKGAFDLSTCLPWTVDDAALDAALQPYRDAGYRIKVDDRRVQKQLAQIPYGEYESRHVRFYWNKYDDEAGEESE